MILFDRNDPYPLLSENSHTYADAQRHAEEVDAWLGLRTEAIESVVAETEAVAEPFRPEGQQLWIGLPVKSLLTPYTEIRQILSCLAPEPGSTIVDLGAGYGRMGFVIGRHYPHVHFLGYEYVEARVLEARRCLAEYDYPLVRMESADLSSPSFHPESARYYFLYDYGTREAIEKTLQDLREIAAQRTIVVVGRGRASRDAIERQHPWLSQVYPPEHGRHYSIYRSGD